MFGLGVEVDHAIGSKALVIELAKLGYSISYDEVKRFKRSVAMDKDGDVVEKMISGFTQWVADNVDHNIVTLDGKGTFHGMGIIACSALTEVIPGRRIKRIAQIMKSQEVVNSTSIKIHWYQRPNIRALAKVALSPIEHLKSQLTPVNAYLGIDALWHCAGLFKKAERQGFRPNWNGFMELVSSGKNHLSKATITMLPLIDLNPSNESCIYSQGNHVNEGSLN